jgi:Rrf2 family protein
MLSAQSKYALRALLYLQRHSEQQVQLLGGARKRSNQGASATEQVSELPFLRVDEIAAETKLPAPYLSKVLKGLAERGIIESRRGKNGGVRLNSSQLSTSFFEVCQAMQDPLVREECMLFKKPCDPNDPCAFHTKWCTTKQKFLHFLKATTLSSPSLHD